MSNSEQLERETEAERARLSETLEELRARIKAEAPGWLKNAAQRTEKLRRAGRYDECRLALRARARRRLMARRARPYRLSLLLRHSNFYGFVDSGGGVGHQLAPVCFGARAVSVLDE